MFENAQGQKKKHTWGTDIRIGGNGEMHNIPDMDRHQRKIYACSVPISIRKALKPKSVWIRNPNQNKRNLTFMNANMPFQMCHPGALPQLRLSQCQNCLKQSDLWECKTCFEAVLFWQIYGFWDSINSIGSVTMANFVLSRRNGNWNNVHTYSMILTSKSLIVLQQ